MARRLRPGREVHDIFDLVEERRACVRTNSGSSPVAAQLAAERSSIAHGLYELAHDLARDHARARRWPLTVAPSVDEASVEAAPIGDGAVLLTKKRHRRTGA